MCMCKININKTVGAATPNGAPNVVPNDAINYILIIFLLFSVFSKCIRMQYFVYNFGAVKCEH